MPTYEYECIECKHRFDVFQSINDSPIEKCVKCKGRVRKLFNSTGIIFKGSGFYVNDYKNSESAKKRTGNGAKKDSSQSNGPSEPVKSKSTASES